MISSLKPVFLIGSICSALWTSDVVAGLILQPSAASSNIGLLPGTNASNVIDQSGLSVSYTNKVTDFDGYLALSPTHNSNSNSNKWLSAREQTTGSFDVNLGGIFTIESMALWNLGGDSAESVVGFTLLADDDSSFSNPTTLGSFSADPALGSQGASPLQVFSFAPTPAAFVRMQITSNNGGVRTGFGELAFEQSTAAVPEPSSLLLIVIGGIAVFARRLGSQWIQGNEAAAT